MHQYQDTIIYQSPNVLINSTHGSWMMWQPIQTNLTQCINYIISQAKANPYDCRNCSVATVATKRQSDVGPKRCVQRLIPVIAASPSLLITIATKQFIFVERGAYPRLIPMIAAKFPSSYCQSNKAINLFRSRAKEGCN